MNGEIKIIISELEVAASKKKRKVLEVSEDQTNRLSRVQNRMRDISAFTEQCDRIEIHPLYKQATIANCRVEANSILKDIQSI